MEMIIKKLLRSKQSKPFAAALLCCAGLSVLAQPINAEMPGGIELLGKMSQAAETLNYSGEFIYVKDGKIAAMKISHLQSEAGGEQKLMSLNGSMREIIQRDNMVACILPDEGMGMKEKRQSIQPFKLNISSEIEDIKRYYNVQYTGQARAANRDCEQLEITPKDELRYGYALCIDSETFLLLRSEITTAGGEILESYMFMNIEYDNISPTDIASATAPTTLKWMDDGVALDDAQKPASDSTPKWSVVSNQSGFEVERYIERISPIMQTQISHLVLGDGLAKVSVFITPSAASANKLKKPVSIGSLNSFTLELEDHMITVIGEVPQQTVAMIAKNTQLN